MIWLSENNISWNDVEMMMKSSIDTKAQVGRLLFSLSKLFMAE